MPVALLVPGTLLLRHMFAEEQPDVDNRLEQAQQFVPYLETRQLAIVDSQGRQRILLTVCPDNVAMILVQSPEGDKRIHVIVNGGEPNIVLTSDLHARKITEDGIFRRDLSRSPYSWQELGSQSAQER